MKTFPDKSLFSLSILSLLAAIVSGFYLSDVGNAITLVAGVLALNFFLYKVFTGWLFINLNINTSYERVKSNNHTDHVVINVALSKGTTDSVWLHDIELRISTVTVGGNTVNYTNPHLRAPINFQKLRYTPPDYWNGKAIPYVISSNEETTFSAYTTAITGDVISVETVVIGTRPFFGTFRKVKTSQWRSSIIILPV
jgi:hypothetical protein